MYSTRTIILYLSILTIGLLGFSSLAAQTDSISTTPFTKGRSLVNLNGSISSSTDNRNSFSGSENVLNNYSFNVRLAKIVAPNCALGLSFETEKYSSQQLIHIDTEVLRLGPWAAYYFTKDQPGGIFIQSAAYFVNFHEENTFMALTPPLNESATGKGFAGSLGLGYTYVIFDRVGLEVAMVYNHTRIFGESTNNTTKITQKEIFNRIDIQFNFGFIVLFNKMKNE